MSVEDLTNLLRTNSGMYLKLSRYLSLIFFLGENIYLQSLNSPAGVDEHAVSVNDTDQIRSPNIDSGAAPISTSDSRPILPPLATSKEGISEQVSQMLQISRMQQRNLEMILRHLSTSGSTPSATIRPVRRPRTCSSPLVPE